ncbi:MAG: histidine phosphatase family protein [Fimbriimonadales bacterium]|nr:histidine phosphatase family protein [Fimbriimonadales bacterium]MCS7190990.1 histidine phosphatase family protein [Fimbriimonadales bacterium]
MLRLYLVRHGQTPWNLVGRIQGHSDTPLDAVGRRQAWQVARWLAERVRQPIAVYSSDLQRAFHTAEAIAQALSAPLYAEPALRERHWGLWEGLTSEEVQQRFPEHHFTYLYDPMMGTPPEAEPMSAFWERVRNFGHHLLEKHPSGEVVLVGHGGSLRILLCEALAGDIQTYRRIRLDNAAVSIVERNAERLYVSLLNYTDHLIDPSVDGF